jgi:hypothetical protein
MRVFITTWHNAHPELSNRNWNRVKRSAMLAVGLKWAIDLLPEHFQRDKQDQFNFAERSSAWTLRKAKLYQLGVAIEPATDLVFRGRMKEQVCQSARNNVRAYPTRSVVTIDGPDYLTFRGRQKRTRRLADEVTAISPRHLRLLKAAAQTGHNDEYRALIRAGKLRKVTRTSAA